MSKRVIFRIDQGNFEQGFPVTLTIRENGRMCGKEVKGKLAIAEKTIELYDKWQENYKSWGKSYRWWRRKIDAPDHMETNSSSYDLQHEAEKSAGEFEEYFNTWLNNSSLEQITRQLLHTVGNNELVSFVVQTDNQELQKLPWEEWNFLQEYYNHAEVALGTASRSPAEGLIGRVKILVILGSDENIEIETDGNIIQNNFPNAELVLLQKPDSSRLRDTLRSQPWNIIFFAGHSATKPEGNDGRIWLNESEYLSPAQLRISLIQAARNGLKLAIFNSCDGLGLARQLESLQIPHIIVMRQRIHDRVAQMFLDTCLKSFANGASLHEAVWKARNELKEIETSSPSASWLPVIFQNPEEPPLFYRRKNYHRLLKLVWCGMGAIASLILTASVPLLPPQQKACDAQLNKNLPLSCGEKALMNPKYSPPQVKKVEGINAIAQHNYPKAVELLTQAWQDKKDPETLIYLNNAKILADNIPESKIYTIPVVVPISNAPYFQSEDIVKGIAWLQERVNNNRKNQWKIRVAIADDGNNIAQAQTIAKELTKRSDILVVIGHYSSHLTTNVKNIYQHNQP